MTKRKYIKKNSIVKDILPKITNKGTIKILDKEFPCAVLDSGQRIIRSSAVFAAFGKVPSSTNSSKFQNSANIVEIRQEATLKPLKDKALEYIAKIPPFITSNNLLPFISDETKEILNPVFFYDTKSRRTYGYSAELIPLLCDVYLQARQNNALYKPQIPIANTAELITRSLAKVGIIALVDEATGYQEIRSKDALQVLLDKYLKKEFGAWAKRFPDEFYIEMFRLKKWDINKDCFSRRPSIVGSITNDIVYSRLAPEIVTELKILNPKPEEGYKKKHHQLLTEDIGHPALSKHLSIVTALMTVANNWKDFTRMLNKALPVLTKEYFLKNLQKKSS